MASDGSELTFEEIAALTDAELVGHFRSMLVEMERLGSNVLGQANASMDEIVALARRLMPFRFPDDRDFESILAMLVARRTTRGEERSRLESDLESMLAGPLARPPTEQEVQFSKCWMTRGIVEREMDSRLFEMLRCARLALGLTLKDVGRVAGIHSKFVERIEQGQTWTRPRGLCFTRVCSEYGLGEIEPSVHRSVWFPLVDPRFCRTIREVAIDPAWLSRNDGASLSLARSIRERRAFDLLPVLGDALEESGCSDAKTLDHCRALGPHLTSCWVVDALVRAGRRG